MAAHRLGLLDEAVADLELAARVARRSARRASPVEARVRLAAGAGRPDGPRRPGSGERVLARDWRRLCGIAGDGAVCCGVTDLQAQVDALAGVVPLSPARG